MVIILLVVVSLALIGTLHAVIMNTIENLQFKRGRNPYSRICKECGAQQDLYQSNIEGWKKRTWWVEMYPIGNNPNCKCHSYAESDRDF